MSFKLKIYRTVDKKVQASGRKLVLSSPVDTDDIAKVVQVVEKVIEKATDAQRATISRIVIEEHIPKAAKTVEPDFG